MIIVLKPGTPEAEKDKILRQIGEQENLEALDLTGEERIVLGCYGDERVLEKLQLRANPFVEDVKPILAPYRLVSREMRPSDTVVRLGATEIGGDGFAVIAGPDAVESAAQIGEVAQAAQAAGAAVLKGGVLRPHMSRYDYAGRGADALAELVAAGREAGLPVATDAASKSHLEEVAQSADAIVIGARNMSNSVLLDAAAEAAQGGAAIFLKRGVSATVEEFLLAAEHLLDAGARDVVLVERGVRSFGTAGTHLDLGAIPFIKDRSHLPILVDPSNGMGRREFVTPMALAACAAGADGVMVDVHPEPSAALSGGERALGLAAFNQLMTALGPVAAAVGRSFA